MNKISHPWEIKRTQKRLPHSSKKSSSQSSVGWSQRKIQKNPLSILKLTSDGLRLLKFLTPYDQTSKEKTKHLNRKGSQAGDYQDFLPAKITMTNTTVKIHRAKAAQTLFGKFFGSSSTVWFFEIFEKNNQFKSKIIISL